MPLAEDATEFERSMAEQPELAPGEKIRREREERERVELARAYHRLFTGLDGVQVLAHLRKLFYESSSLTVDCDPNVCLAREGRRYVLVFIDEMMKLAEVAGAGTSSSESRSE
jgi:hypothetical protein